ncbi:protein kinase [candidate division KSB1 bacterium]|nr:protein kinase [candidate division KSB1 bacterium]
MKISTGKTISHFKILEKLGSGGMGVLYKAKDTKLNRAVALKFLPFDLTRDPDAKERFIREAQTASALDHPNICTIYQISETEDQQIFIAMAYYEGQTLKEKIKNKPLDIDEALDIVGQIAAGLAKAHAEGIVHRDIKPANIMITREGIVKILDFGLAKLIGQSGITTTGSRVGTVAYMSPEQALGKTIDHRTDIWSVGVVLYEMLTGQLPFKGDIEQAVIYSILNEEPEPITHLQPDIPDYLEQIIYQALQKDQTVRYHSIRHFLEDIKASSASGQPAPEREKSIVVLPFENISVDKENEYFTEGLTDEIITDLSHINELRVISRNSALTLKGTKKRIKAIGRELNVQYVLEGSVRKAGNNYRITAQLIDANNDIHLWGEKYTGTLDDIFDIQEKVSGFIVEALRIKLTPEERQKMVSRPISNVHIYECYLRARQALWFYKEEALKRAEQELHNALEIVGPNELLYATLGAIYNQYVEAMIESETDYLKKAEEYTQKVFELNPDSSHGFRLSGLNNYKRGNLQQAVRDYKRALSNDANNPDILQQLSYCYMLAGKTHAATPYIKKAVEIDPLTPLTHSVRGFQYFIEAKYEKALVHYRRMFQLGPDSPVTHLFFAWVLASGKHSAEAVSIIEQLTHKFPHTIITQLGLFLQNAIIGNKKDVLQAVTQQLKSAAKWVECFSRLMADCYAMIDAKDDAIDWLENAVNLGLCNHPYISKYDSLLENIRGEKRFKLLMEKVKTKWQHFEV